MRAVAAATERELDTTLRETNASLVDQELQVALIEWPARHAEREHLARLGLPRLLLVPPGNTPPASHDPLEDWIRLPTDTTELRARLHTLAQRQRTDEIPTVDEYGVLRRHTRLVFLAPQEQKLAEILIDNFRHVVPSVELERQLFDGDRRAVALRVHTSRLRKRIAPLGLDISCIRGNGYLMHPSGQPTSRTAESTTTPTKSSRTDSGSFRSE